MPQSPRQLSNRATESRVLGSVTIRRVRIWVGWSVNGRERMRSTWLRQLSGRMLDVVHDRLR